MAERRNNHEKTTGSVVREELEKAISGSIGNISPQKKQETISRVEAVFERYSSPYPDPTWLAEIEALCEGAAREILDETKLDLAHRRAMEAAENDLKKEEIGTLRFIASREFWSNTLGRLFGFLAFLACIGFAILMVHWQQTALAFAGFGAAALGVVAQLIRGQRSRSIVVAADDPPDAGRTKT